MISSKPAKPSRKKIFSRCRLRLLIKKETGDVYKRQKRRYLEMKDTDPNADLDEIEREIIARDKTDSTRKFAPLCQAPDALLVDTTEMSREQVIKLVAERVSVEK